MAFFRETNRAAPSGRSFFLLCLAAFLVAVLAVAWLSRSLGIPFLPVDDYDGVAYPRNPAVSVAETARSFWETGSLSRPGFGDIRGWFRAQSLRQPDLRFTPDVYAVARDGRLLPKHCWLVSVLAAPFYGVAGTAGLWLFNQAALFGLLWGVYGITRRMAGRTTSLAACLLAVLGTNLLWKYSYTFSYDVWGTACLVGGGALAVRFPVAAGLLFAASLYARLTNAVLVPFLVLWAVSVGGGGASWWVRLAVAGAAGVVPLLGYNTLCFGAPLAGPYACIESFVAGRAVPDSVTHFFSPRLLVEHLGARLGNPRDGLLVVQPVYWLLALAAAGWRRPALRRPLGLLLAGAAGLVLLMLSFSYWEGSGGDRFVLPATALVCAAVAAGGGELLARRPGRGIRERRP